MTIEDAVADGGGPHLRVRTQSALIVNVPDAMVRLASLTIPSIATVPLLVMVVPLKEAGMTASWLDDVGYRVYWLQLPVV